MFWQFWLIIPYEPAEEHTVVLRQLLKTDWWFPSLGYVKYSWGKSETFRNQHGCAGVAKEPLDIAARNRRLEQSEHFLKWICADEGSERKGFGFENGILQKNVSLSWCSHQNILESHA